MSGVKHLVCFWAYPTVPYWYPSRQATELNGAGTGFGGWCWEDIWCRGDFLDTVRKDPSAHNMVANKGRISIFCLVYKP